MFDNRLVRGNPQIELPNQSPASGEEQKTFGALLTVQLGWPASALDDEQLFPAIGGGRLGRAGGR